MYQIFKYDEIKEITLFLKKNESGISVTHSNVYVYSRQIYKGKDAYWDKDGDGYSGGPKWDVNFRCKDIADSQTYPTLFVDPASKISRDVLRNGGFKITYTAGNAGCVVIPKPGETPNLTCRFAALKNDTLYLFSVRRRHGYSNLDDPWTADEFEACREAVRSTLGFNDDSEIIYDWKKAMKELTFWFLKKCETFREILTQPRIWTRKYCFDTNIDLRGNFTDITPESLMVWSKINDNRMLEKAILNSNWQKYPMTVCVFLQREKNSCRYGFSQAGKVMLDAINFDVLDRARTLGDQSIDPEDWNLLQSYIMLRVGLDEKGGFIKEGIYPYDDFVRKRVAVAPLKSDGQRSFKTLMNEVKSS